MKSRRLPFFRPRMGASGGPMFDHCVPTELAADDGIGAGVTDTYACGLSILDGVTLTISDTGTLALTEGF